jgi:Flp pilus assembly protein TadG
MIIAVTLVLFGLVLMMIVMEYGGVYHTAAVAQTRADAIADSAATYAVSSWDRNFNEADAQFMAASMQTFNNTEKQPITTQSKVTGPIGAKNRLEVATRAEGKFYFIRFDGERIAYEAEREAVVEAVDPIGMGHVLVP